MFAKSTSELGCTNLHYHTIDSGDASPQRQHPYHTSPEIKQVIQEHVDDMLENDIIEPSNSFWAAPVVICKKKDS